MSIEIEAKFRTADPEPVRQRLRELAARPGGRFFEMNHMYDTRDGRLRTADCGLRLRVCRPLDPDRAAEQPPALLTYKGPRAPGDPKIREELETAVADPARLAEILARLGFHEVVVYEKRRERWHLDACEVALDELPDLGWWIEIEGPDAAAIAHLQAQLGLAATPAVRETYVAMAATRGHLDAHGCRRLVFAESHGPG